MHRISTRAFSILKLKVINNNKHLVILSIDIFHLSIIQYFPRTLNINEYENTKNRITENVLSLYIMNLAQKYLKI